MRINKEIRLQREKTAWELRQKMWSQDKIAEELGITQSGVAKLLKRLTLRYAESFSEDIETVKAEQVAQLENIAFEAMQAWERSKEAANVVRVKRPLQGTSGEGEQTKEARDQDGDPRYLATAMKAKEDIRKILGADAPTKLQHAGDKDGDAIKIDITSTKARLLAKLSSLSIRGREASNT